MRGGQTTDRHSGFVSALKEHSGSNPSKVLDNTINVNGAQFTGSLAVVDFNVRLEKDQNHPNQRRHRTVLA